MLLDSIKVSSQIWAKHVEKNNESMFNSRLSTACNDLLPVEISQHEQTRRIISTFVSAENPLLSILK